MVYLALSLKILAIFYIFILKGSPLSTVSPSVIPGIVRIKIVLKLQVQKSRDLKIGKVPVKWKIGNPSWEQRRVG